MHKIIVNRPNSSSSSSNPPPISPSSSSSSAPPCPAQIAERPWQTLAQDIDDTVAIETEINELKMLAAWSQTPKFDRSALDILQPAMFLVCKRHSAIAASTGNISLKKIPSILPEAYAAAKAVIHPGAERIMPCLTFLVGDVSVAQQLFKHCEVAALQVDACMHKLNTAVSGGLEAAVQSCEACVFSEVMDNKEFETKFKLADCEAAHKTLMSSTGKAELLQKTGVDVKTEAAMDMKQKVRAAINRFALIQMLGRPNLSHASKGKALRTQLSSIWKAVSEHGLNDLLPKELCEEVERVLPKKQDEQPEADTPEAKAAKPDAELDASTGKVQPKKRRIGAKAPSC